MPLVLLLLMFTSSKVCLTIQKQDNVCSPILPFFHCPLKKRRWLEDLFLMYILFLFFVTRRKPFSLPPTIKIPLKLLPYCDRMTSRPCSVAIASAFIISQTDNSMEVAYGPRAPLTWPSDSRKEHLVVVRDVFPLYSPRRAFNIPGVRCGIRFVSPLFAAGISGTALRGKVPSEFVMRWRLFGSGGLKIPRAVIIIDIDRIGGRKGDRTVKF